MQTESNTSATEKAAECVCLTARERERGKALYNSLILKVLYKHVSALSALQSIRLDKIYYSNIPYLKPGKRAGKNTDCII